ncbi:MAG: polymer-forming cytoskeletal protein [Desulfobacteraceae bacterium]|nr:polymer-forming cytoskeletal protein [Desulfobacteraceae bacterium]
MLGKRKSEKSDTVAKSNSVSVGGKTIIGENITIEGSIRGKETLVIEGTVKGKIQLENHHLIIGPKGQVEAEIRADNVTISGRLIGDVQASGKVEITKEADFNGEIKAKRISVEDGAYLKAVIELEREPEKKAAPIGKPAGQVAFGPGKGEITLASEANKGK